MKKIKKNILTNFVHNEGPTTLSLYIAKCTLLLTNRIFMHKGSFDFVLLSSSWSHFVTEKWSRAIHICDASMQSSGIRASLFREVKDTSRGSCLKCIGSVLSNRFILVVLRRRSNESAWRNGWASHSRGTIGHAGSELQYRLPLPCEHYVKKLKTVTRGN